MRTFTVICLTLTTLFTGYLAFMNVADGFYRREANREIAAAERRCIAAHDAAHPKDNTDDRAFHIHNGCLIRPDERAK